MLPILAAAESRPSAEYTATVAGRAVHVFACPGFSGGTVAWIAFDHDFAAEGPVELRVRAARMVDSCSVRPLAAGVTARLESDERTAVLTLTRTGHYFLKWDEAFVLPVYIFANPPSPSAEEVAAGPVHPEGAHVARDLPALITFGPGVHRPGQIRLRSGQTLHLAAGAEVYGTVIAEDASDIRICGRGTLRGSHLPFGGTEKESYMLCLRRCRRVLIEGITMLDGPSWTVILHHCEDVVCRWLKIMTERLWSTDGINPSASRRVLIEDCFIRTKDDCVAVKGLDWEHPDPRDWVSVHDITVRRVVAWSDNNNGFVVGGESRASEITRVLIEDCDLLHVSNTCGDDAGALTVLILDDTRIHGVVFRDIRVEWCLGPLFNAYFTDEVFGIPGTRLPRGGEITDITFERIQLLAGPSRRSFLRALDARRRVHGITFREITVRGQRVRSAAELRLVATPHAHDVRFE
jgi:hypothetical protein